MDAGFPFSLLFKEAREAFARGDPPACHSEGSFEESLLAAHASTAPKLAAELAHLVATRNAAALEELRHRRAHRAAESAARQRALAHRRQRVAARVTAAVATAAARDQHYLHRMDRQFEGTERRLQELIFECLGEAAKARGRACHRSKQLALEVDRELSECRRAFQWSQFGARFEEENPSVALVVLDPASADFGECGRFAVGLLRPLLPAATVEGRRSPRVTCLVEVSLVSGRMSRRQRDHPNVAGAPSRDPADLVDQLRRSARLEQPSMPRLYPLGTLAVPSFDKSLLLSSRLVAWLLTEFKLVNSRVYYHLEGRAAPSSSTGGGPSVADVIASRYSSSALGRRDAPLRLEVAAALAAHRSTSASSSDAAQAYPDVLAVRDGASTVHHFAAACLEQLQEVRDAAALGQLYVPVWRDAAAQELAPLRPEVLRELFSVYLSREPSSGLAVPGAAAVFPVASTDDKAYFVVQNPTLPQRTSGAAAAATTVALLVEYDFLGAPEADARPEDRANANKWDGALLGPFCRWRSCLSHASALPAPRSLCAHHSQLKQFLDVRTTKGGPSETSRFLPKRPPVQLACPPTTADDLAMLKAASSLLQELVEGKLASTIDAFCQRACGDASDRQWRERAGAAPSPPSWLRRAHAGPTSSALAAIDREWDTHTALLAAERAATHELDRLAALGVYPTAELALIRRDASALGTEGLDASGQRKLALLRLRREAAELEETGKSAGVAAGLSWQHGHSLR